MNRLFPDSPGGQRDQRHDRRSRTRKPRRNERKVLSRGMEPGERRHEQGSGHDEKRAGEQSTGHPALPPARVGGQLLGLRTRQEHAEPHGGKKFFFIEPLAAFHHLPVQDGHLSRRAAKARGADHQPGLPGFGRHPALLCVGGTSSSDISRRSTTL
jgi:hypothetical protein